MPETKASSKLAPARLARILGVGLTLLVAGSYPYIEVRLLNHLELKTYDMRLKSAHSAPPQDVTIAAIDEQSLAQLGQWPWSRVVLARLVDRLEQAGARVVAFDVFFAERESPQADARFARAISAGHNVVLSTVFLLNREDARPFGAERLEEAKRAITAQAIANVRQSGTASAEYPRTAPQGIIVNIPELQRSAAYAGHINILPDADGTVRRAPLVYRYDGRYFPSSDLQAAHAFLGGDLILHAASYGIEGVQIGERFIPTDEEGNLLVRYRGGTGTFRSVSIADVLDGRADPASLRGRIVLIGTTAQGLGDLRVTPFGSAFHGVELRASIIQNLLEGDVLQQPGWMALVDVAAMIVLGLALTFALPRLGIPAGAALASGVLVAYVLFANHVFQAEGLWLNVVYPSLLIALLFASTTLVRYFSTESEKRDLKIAFQHYVPPAVVDEILADTSKLRLGGEKRDLTVLFSDIRGFTSMSEALEPEDLVKLLNAYFTEMTDQVFAHKGSLDKYIGDAIMAVFGAPVAQPEHARLACRAALDMVAALEGLQAQWRRDGLPAIEIGIGINTGPVIVGNMGSVSRFNYTVVGDAVNLASRMESLNKTYGTNILVSESTYAMVGDEFPHSREIDRIRVRGRSQVVGIYELIPEGRYPDLGWLAEFADAYRLLRSGEYARAAERFDALHARVGDRVSAYHAQTCRTPRRRGSDAA
jgi:adenylate cyclase